jgi:hypothetical protein
MVGSRRVRGLKKKLRHVRDISRPWLLKRNMRRLPARTQSYELR